MTGTDATAEAASHVIRHRLDAAWRLLDTYPQDDPYAARTETAELVVRDVLRAQTTAVLQGLDVAIGRRWSEEATRRRPATRRLVVIERERAALREAWTALVLAGLATPRTEGP